MGFYSTRIIITWGVTVTAAAFFALGAFSYWKKRKKTDSNLKKMSRNKSVQKVTQNKTVSLINKVSSTPLVTESTGSDVKEPTKQTNGLIKTSPKKFLSNKQFEDAKNEVIDLSHNESSNCHKPKKYTSKFEPNKNGICVVLLPINDDQTEIQSSDVAKNKVLMNECLSTSIKQTIVEELPLRRTQVNEKTEEETDKKIINECSREMILNVQNSNYISNENTEEETDEKIINECSSEIISNENSNYISNENTEEETDEKIINECSSEIISNENSNYISNENTEEETDEKIINECSSEIISNENSNYISNENTEEETDEKIINECSREMILNVQNSNYISNENTEEETDEKIINECSREMILNVQNSNYISNENTEEETDEKIINECSSEIISNENSNYISNENTEEETDEKIINECSSEMISNENSNYISNENTEEETDEKIINECSREMISNENSNYISNENTEEETDEKIINEGSRTMIPNVQNSNYISNKGVDQVVNKENFFSKLNIDSIKIFVPRSQSATCPSNLQSDGSSDLSQDNSDEPSPPPANEAAQASSSIMTNGEVIEETNPAVTIENLYSYNFGMDRYWVGRLIGKDNSNLHAVKQKTGTDISIANHPQLLTMCLVILKGTESGILKALDLIQKRFPRDRYPKLNLNQIMEVNPMTQSQAIMRSIKINQMELSQHVLNDCTVSAVAEPNIFYLQQPLHPSFPSYERMTKYMTDVYSNSFHPKLTCSIPTTFCVAPLDGYWYRGMIMSFNDETKEARIKFLDTGIFRNFNLSELRQIRNDLLTLPFQASPVNLADIEPLESNEVSIQDSDRTRIYQLIPKGILLAKVVGFGEDSNPIVKLYSREKEPILYVNELLVNNGFAKWKT